uniref:Uncharacterized protein n=1 Tax=Tetradesmus obliquus TaxID=3088 RepID=A0A383VCA2_TETOB
MEQPDALHEGDEDELFIQDDTASDGEEDALESVIQQELAKFQQQQAVKYAELAASGWVALPLPSPAPVQQLLRAEEHQLETDTSGPAKPSLIEDERTEYVPAAKPAEHWLCVPPGQQQQQQQQQHFDSPFSAASLDGPGFARPWSAAGPGHGELAAPAGNSEDAGEETAWEAAEAAAQQGSCYDPMSEQDVDAEGYEDAEQQLSEEQYEFDADTQEDEAEDEQEDEEQLLDEESAAVAHAEQQLSGGEYEDEAAPHAEAAEDAGASAHELLDPADREAVDEEQQQQQQQLQLQPGCCEPAVHAEEQELAAGGSPAGDAVRQHQQLLSRAIRAEGDADVPTRLRQQQQQQQQELANLTCSAPEEVHAAEAAGICDEKAAAGDGSQGCAQQQQQQQPLDGDLEPAYAQDLVAEASQEQEQQADFVDQSGCWQEQQQEQSVLSKQCSSEAIDSLNQAAGIGGGDAPLQWKELPAVQPLLAAAASAAAEAAASSVVGDTLPDAPAEAAYEALPAAAHHNALQEAAAPAASAARHGVSCSHLLYQVKSRGCASFLAMDPPPAAAGTSASSQQHEQQWQQQQLEGGAVLDDGGDCADLVEEVNDDADVNADGEDDGFVYQDDGEDSSCCSTPPGVPAAAVPAPVPAAAPAAAPPALEAKVRVSISSPVSSVAPTAVPASLPAGAAGHSTALGLRSLPLRGSSRSSADGCSGQLQPPQQQQQQQQQQQLWQPAEGITGWQTDEQGWPSGSGAPASAAAGYCQPIAPVTQAAVGRRSSSGGMNASGSPPQQQQQQQQHCHLRGNRPVHSRARPAGASSPLLEAAREWKASESIVAPVQTPGRSLSAGRVVAGSRVRPGSAPCRQSLTLSPAAKASLLSSTRCSTSRAWVPGGARATQQHLLQVYGQQQQQQGLASPRGALRPVGMQARCGSSSWGAFAAAAAANAGVTQGVEGARNACRPRTASPVRRPPWQQLSAGCSSASAADGAATSRRAGGMLSAEQQQQQQQACRPRPCSAGAMRSNAFGSALLQSSRPGSSSNGRRDLRAGMNSGSSVGHLPWRQQQLQQLAEGDVDGVDSDAGVECWCDGQFVGGLAKDSRQRQQRAWDDSPIPLNVPNSMPLADSTQDAGQQLAARANGRCVSASRAYGYAAGSGLAAADRPHSAGAGAADASWEVAAAGGAGSSNANGSSSSSSSSTSVYLTETLQKLKQANSCCRKLGLGRQYALAPISKPRWQLQHIALDMWQCCAQQQQEQEQQSEQADSWQLRSSLTLGQFSRQLDKLQAKVDATAAAAASQAAAGAGSGTAAAYVGGGSSNCSSLFSSPAGSRPGSPARTRPGSAGAAQIGSGSSSMRPSSAVHCAGQVGGWLNPAAVAIPEGGCRGSSRLSPRRQQQQQQQQDVAGDFGVSCADSAAGGLAAAGLAAGQPHAVLGAAGSGSGVVGVRAGGLLPYAVPAWLEEHL